MNKQRESNIELLRILLAVGVIVLHYNYYGGVFDSVRSGSANQILFYFTENIFICAVDTFVLISGYFLSTTKTTNYIRIIKIILQTMLFGAGWYLLTAILHNIVGIELFKGVVIALIPKNYYVTFYVVICVLAPFINKFMATLSQYEWKRFVLILVYILSIWAVVADVITSETNIIYGISPISADGSQAGYTLINFILMYIIGAYIRENPIKTRISIHIIVLAGLTLLLVLWSFLTKENNLPTANIVWAYNNPVIILYSANLFILFSKIKIGCSKIINFFGKASFSVYLLHISLIPHFKIERFVNSNIMVLIGHMLFTIVVIYMISTFASVVYEIIINENIDRILKKFKES